MARLARLEVLESRKLLHAFAVGPELPVSPINGDNHAAAVATDSDGDFVVAWTSYGDDGDGYGIFAQRYNSAGAPLGAFFQVNTFTTSDQLIPAVAMDADGDFVIVWDSFEQDGSYYGVYAQRYNAAGVPQGSEFRVNTRTSADQFDASVAMDADGDFVITWTSDYQDGSYFGVYAQRYNAAGTKQGGEFRVNTTTADEQFEPAVAMDAAGDFVIAWTSYDQDGDYYGAYAQRYNAAGVAQGNEFRVNTYNTAPPARRREASSGSTR
jgi:hypothetical protein